MASNESSEWILKKAHGELKANPALAKAWLLTAKSLYPKDFLVQFEEYQVERRAGNVAKCAELLNVLLEDFPENVTLWSELGQLVDVLKEDDTVHGFYCDLFKELPKDSTYKIILHVAEKCSGDVVGYTQTMMQLMQRFPQAAQDHGVRLIDRLMALEASAGGTLSVARKLLVHDVLPLFLSRQSSSQEGSSAKASSKAVDAGKQSVVLPTRLLKNLLEKSLEFYVTLLAKGCHGATTAGGAHTDLSSVGRNLPSEARDVWSVLYNTLNDAGRLLKWKIADFCVNSSGPDAQLSQLQAVYEGLLADQSSSSGRKLEVGLEGLLYAGLTLYLRTSYDYVRSAHCAASSGSADQGALGSGGGGGNAQSLPLVPLLLLVDTKDGPDAKRARLSTECAGGRNKDSSRQQTAAANLEVFSRVHAFLLSRDDRLRRDATRLLGQWPCASWLWMALARCDLSVLDLATNQGVGAAPAVARCQAVLDSAAQLESCLAAAVGARSPPPPPGGTTAHAGEGPRDDTSGTDFVLGLHFTSGSTPLGGVSAARRLLHRRLRLHRAMVQLRLAHLGNSGQRRLHLSSMFAHIKWLVDDLATRSGPDQYDTRLKETCLAAGRRNRWQMFPLRDSEVLAYIIHLLVFAFKNHVQSPSSLQGVGDLALGHCLVLSQWDWPQTGRHLARHILNTIRRRESFAYVHFFDFCTNIDILEEIAYLHKEQHNLELHDDLPSENIGRRTRGVHKEETQDFQVMMEQQALRCDDPQLPLLGKFLTSQMESIADCLTVV